MTRFFEVEGRDVLRDPTPPPAIEKWPASGPPQKSWNWSLRISLPVTVRFVFGTFQPLFFP